MRRPQEVKAGFRAEFQWVDSSHRMGWGHETDPELAVVKTIGIIVGVDDSGVAVTTSVIAEGGFHTVLSVPWCAIKKFKQFEKCCEVK